MIDIDFKPWLIEVNMNPCLETGCSLLHRIISGLIEQTLRVAVDPIFVPPLEWRSKKYMIGDMMDCKYSLIFDSIINGEELMKMEESGYLSEGELWDEYK